MLTLETDARVISGIGFLLAMLSTQPKALLTPSSKRDISAVLGR